MDRGAWLAIVHSVTRSWTQLSTHAYTHTRARTHTHTHTWGRWLTAEDKDINSQVSDTLISCRVGKNVDKWLEIKDLLSLKKEV